MGLFEEGPELAVGDLDLIDVVSGQPDGMGGPIVPGSPSLPIVNVAPGTRTIRPPSRSPTMTSGQPDSSYPASSFGLKPGGNILAGRASRRAGRRSMPAFSPGGGVTVATPGFEGITSVASPGLGGGWGWGWARIAVGGWLGGDATARGLVGAPGWGRWTGDPSVGEPAASVREQAPYSP